MGGVFRSGCNGVLGSRSILSREDDSKKEKSRVVAALVVAVCDGRWM